MVLFTGLSGAGKSTLAAGLAAHLRLHDPRRVTLLDGDEVRESLSSGLGFSRADRDTHVQRIGWVATRIAEHGGIALCALIAPYREARERVRRMAESSEVSFLLVHVATSLSVCEARDTKGLYARARAGDLARFTGVSDPYETPEYADIVLDTARESVAESVRRVAEAVEQARSSVHR